MRVVLQGQFPVSLFRFFLGGIGFDLPNHHSKVVSFTILYSQCAADAGVGEREGARCCAQLGQSPLLCLSPKSSVNETFCMKATNDS